MAGNNQKAGAPAWVLTFADLMSLLLAFFVLLFSFSELDKQLYKQVAGSMRDAFGVQREIRVKEPPKGLNLIAREFSPGIPLDSAVNQVRQFTTRDALPYPMLADTKERGRAKRDAQVRRRLDQERIRLALEEEVAKGLIEIEETDRKIILRIREKGSFPSGSHRLESPFEAVMERLAKTLEDANGDVVISGHTDSIPIENAQFRSNWELSAARAATVAHFFMGDDAAGQRRVHLEAYADTRPVDTNETPAGRAKNRRVEIAVVYGEDALFEGDTFRVPVTGISGEEVKGKTAP